MSLEVWYWLCMFLALIGGVWANWSKPKEGVPFALLWIILLILGLAHGWDPVK